MVDLLARHRGGRRGRRRRMRAAALDYAALGWPVCPGARPSHVGGRACSCDRVGCPRPGAHPVSAAWQIEASVDARVVDRWWRERPDANIILPTGRVFDVFDVPARAGARALADLGSSASVGPVVADEAAHRYLFFVATRGAPVDEDEWWSCHLDCFPETLGETPGLRWHCRDSYVLAPPSVLPSGQQVSWIRPPTPSPLPDPLRLLDVLADACGG